MTFVVVQSGPYRNLGFGRLISKRAGKAVVEFFNAPGDGNPPRFDMPISAIQPRTLPEQTRVFWQHSSGTWRVGRVLSCDEEKVLVQFPNQEMKNLPISDVFVRWRKPIEDPTIYLARMITETPLFADSRSAFYKSYVKQRAASLGMGGYLSAQIEIERHQFEVVRRVLQDPIQRYLLADEVGLGKTIEAGALIRQFFIDHLRDLTAYALVLVPEALLQQWTAELKLRFGLGQELDERLQVIPHAEHLEIQRALQARPRLLVIDEAHHLSRKGLAGNEPLFELIRAHIAHIPRVLLLSATPALVDEVGFLRLLHLLDPMGFPIDDVKEFQHRIEARQVVAEAMAALSPENALLLESYLERLVQALPTDQTLTQHIERLRKIIVRVPEETDPELLSVLNALRFHVSETYRLHRRILRNRRKNVPNLTPQRIGLQTYPYRDVCGERYFRCFEEWRQAVANSSESIPQAWITEVVSAYFGAPTTLYELLNQKTFKTLGAVTAKLTAAAVEFCSSDERLAALTKCLAESERNKAKTVVFCSDAKVADQIFEYLRRADPRSVVRHRTDVYDRDIDPARPDWHRFMTQSLCRILVCDQDAEEGLNLQGDRKVVVHFDLPFSPNRIEQRLGRIDRYGSGAPILSMALMCENNPYEAAWADCLKDGFGLFSRSIASLQYLVDRTMDELSASLVEAGVEAIDVLTTSLAGPDGRVERELMRIDQSDAMDALVMNDDRAFEAFEEMDSDWSEIAASFKQLAVRTLKFSERPENIQNLSQGDSVVRFRFQRGGAADTLLPVSDFVQFFVGTIDFENANSKAPQTFPYSARRPTVLREDVRKRKGRVLRYGDATVEALASFTEMDDRGRVFALWRVQPGYQASREGGCDVFFRFEFLIEADTSMVEALLSKTDGVGADWLNPGAMKHRAEGLFRPLFLRIWVDDQMAVVESQSVLDILNRGYQKVDGRGEHLDFNLNPGRWDTLRGRDLYQLQVWEGLCKEARAVAENAAKLSSDVKRAVDDASGALDAFELMRISQLTSRISTLDGHLKDAETKNIEHEKAILIVLKQGFVKPSVRLDSVGAVFLSSFHPF